MSFEPHLNLAEAILPPGGEWTPDTRCWTVARVAEGFGYCLQAGQARDLRSGDTVIAGPAAEVTLRASQLGELRLEHFRVMPQRLNGLITIMEWRQLERLSTQAAPRVFHYPADHALARKFARLATQPEHDSLVARSALLQLWAACVSGVLLTADEPVEPKKNLEASFRRFISKISEKELATTSMADMAAQLNCSERHLSRLFRLEFGMSLREKQTELSLQRACQLLADPHTKIRAVAFDTGYRHVGFFNSVFKKRFGQTPKEWRLQHLARTGDQPSEAGVRPLNTPAAAAGNPPDAAAPENGSHAPDPVLMAMDHPTTGLTTPGSGPPRPGGTRSKKI